MLSLIRRQEYASDVPITVIREEWPNDGRTQALSCPVGRKRTGCLTKLLANVVRAHLLGGGGHAMLERIDLRYAEAPAARAASTSIRLPERTS
jgi:hypothetical protein